MAYSPDTRGTSQAARRGLSAPNASSRTGFSVRPITSTNPSPLIDKIKRLIQNAQATTPSSLHLYLAFELVLVKLTKGRQFDCLVRSPTSCDQATGPVNRAQKRKDRKNAVAIGIEKMAQVSEHDQGELQFMNHPSGTPCA